MSRNYWPTYVCFVFVSVRLFAQKTRVENPWKLFTNNTGRAIAKDKLEFYDEFFRVVFFRTQSLFTGFVLNELSNNTITSKTVANWNRWNKHSAPSTADQTTVAVYFLDLRRINSSSQRAVCDPHLKTAENFAGKISPFFGSFLRFCVTVRHQWWIRGGVIALSRSRTEFFSETYVFTGKNSLSYRWIVRFFRNPKF